MKEIDTPIATHKIIPHSAPWISPVAHIGNRVAGLANPGRTEKRWGWELTYMNSEDYCMKMLYIRANSYTSMHFHVKKHETLLVTEGELLLKYKNKVGIEKEIVIPRNHAWVVCPGFQHQLVAYHGDVCIIEASTKDLTNDSVRVHL
jgi:D-lyxose ketol-isomerase